MTSRELSLLGLVAAMCIATSARADGSPENVATAQALFEDAKRLMDQKNFEAACPKFAESQRLDPAGGTLLLLAMCHEGQGKTASAWGEFDEALSAARRDKRSDREAAALEHIKALEPRLTRAVVMVSKEVPGLEIKRDGQVVGKAQWGTPIPINPGTYQFEVTAPGYKGWKGPVSLQGEGKTLAVNIPSLQEDTTPPPAVTQATPPKDDQPVRRHKRGDDSGKKDLTLAFVAGGIGVVGLGVGTITGLMASSKWSDAHNKCLNNRCPSQQYVDEGKSAKTLADVSTVSFIIGATGGVAAAILYAVAPQAAKNSDEGLRITPIVTAKGGALVVGGSL